MFRNGTLIMYIRRNNETRLKTRQNRSDFNTLRATVDKTYSFTAAGVYVSSNIHFNFQITSKNTSLQQYYFFLRLPLGYRTKVLNSLAPSISIIFILDFFHKVRAINLLRLILLYIYRKRST